MSEWLTTGQMIDRLKVGEVAEHENNGRVYKVKKTLKGIIVCSYSDEKLKGRLLALDASILEQKWRILPKYVTFDEAMRELKDGYTVRCFPGTFDDDSFIEFNEADTLKAVSDSWHGLSFGDLAQGKWQIID